MDASQQQLWGCRASKQIIIVDSDTKSVDAAKKITLPMMILKDAIYKVSLRVFKFTGVLFMCFYIFVSLILAVIYHMSHSYWMVDICDGIRLTPRTA